MARRPTFVGSLSFAVLGLSLLVFGGYWLFFANQPPKPDLTWARIKDQGVLKIGIDPSFPPFESDDGQGHLSGFDIALADAIARNWNVTVQYVYTGYDGLYDALQSGQCDIILSALTYNPSKTQDVSFSHSYFDGGPVLVVRAGTHATTLAEVSGRGLGVELGASGDAVARHWQSRLKYDLREFNTTVEALQAVEAGLVEGALVDPISFYDFQRLSANASSDLQIVGKPLADEQYIIATRRNTPKLMLQLNMRIDAMKRDGSLMQLQKTWF